MWKPGNFFAKRKREIWSLKAFSEKPGSWEVVWWVVKIERYPEKHEKRPALVVALLWLLRVEACLAEEKKPFYWWAEKRYDGGKGGASFRKENALEHIGKLIVLYQMFCLYYLGAAILNAQRLSRVLDDYVYGLVCHMAVGNCHRWKILICYYSN